jgi:hypothetical protein
MAVLLVGCGEMSSHKVYPITTGSHVHAELMGFGRKDVSGQFVPSQKQTFVVWSNSEIVGNYLSSQLMANNHAVVERSRLQKVLDEQNLRISQAGTASDLTSAILGAGKLLGVSQVIFAEVRPQSGVTVSGTAQPASVSLRSVSVESGEVRWAGIAHFAELVADGDQGLIILAHMAMARATCRIEDGDRWEEASEGHIGGCQITPEGNRYRLYEWLKDEHQQILKQQAVLVSETDPKRKEQLTLEWKQRVDRYNKQKAIYEQQKASPRGDVKE